MKKDKRQERVKELLNEKKIKNEEACSSIVKAIYYFRKKNEEAEEMLEEVLYQACGDSKDNGMIDNRCMRPYDQACEFLRKRGRLVKINDRLYKIKEGGK